MSEMEYERAPEVHVPRVRDWLHPALRAWFRAMYGHRARTFSLFEWFFFWPLILFYRVVKLMLYAGVGLLLMVAFGFWAIAELITYRHRYKREVLRAYGPYMGELHGKTPPPMAA